MAKITYAIMGATGQIGRVISEELLKKGHIVHAIGRDQTKLKSLKEKGAEIFATPFDDHLALIEAFKGCKAVFSFLPPVYTIDNCEEYTNKVGEAIKQALILTKIQNVLNLSSVGATTSTGTGVIKGLHDQEVRLNTIPNLNVIHFRPSYFMENLLSFIPLIKKEGIIGSIIRPDLSIPMIAVHDIALKIAELLILFKFQGKTAFEFVGPQSLTIPEVTTILGKAIKKPSLKYVQISSLEAEKNMLALGIKPEPVKLMLEMYEAFNAGKIITTQWLTSVHKGHTTLEEFAKTFATIYRSTK